MNTRYTVSGVVQKGTQIVLGRKEPGRIPYPGTWHTPGGGARDAELAAKLWLRQDFDNQYFHDELRRELREELSIEVKNIRCVAPHYLDAPQEIQVENKHGVMTHHYCLEYVCDYASGELKAGDDLVEAEWVEKSALHTYNLSPPSQNLFRALGWLAYRNPDGQVTSPFDGVRVWALMGTVGWQVAGPLLLLGIGGALLDRRLGTGPLFMLLGAAAAIAVSYVLVRGTVRRMQAEVAARAPHKESKS